MEWWEDRIVNGLAKAGGGYMTREQIQKALAQDIAIYADPARATQDDLWPGIWALAATLSRQFSGYVFISAGLEVPLAVPTSLSSRCIFTASPPSCSLAVGLGQIPPKSDGMLWWGDTRADQITVGKALEGNERATPWGAFAIAGYLAYALLASAAGLAPYKERFCKTTITIGPPELSGFDVSSHSLAILGLGHLGNAYLALLFFIAKRNGGFPRLMLLDRGEGGGNLEAANWKTHILLPETSTWAGALKTAVFGELMKAHGAIVNTDPTTLDWGWKRPSTHPPIALLGFDSFDARRMAMAAGYDWLIDSGIGMEFDRPRISWHSLPSDREVGKMLFGENPNGDKFQIPMDSPLAKSLDDVADPCGWVRLFHGISAAAPSMGIVAAAYSWVEVMKALDGIRVPLCGSAYLWSPGIPASVELL